MKRLSPIVFSFCLCTCLMLSIPKAQAAPTAQQISQAKTDVSAFVAQWRTGNANAPVNNSPALQRYILDKRRADNTTQYPVLGNNPYQPLYILPKGGWLMGFVQLPTGIGALVDVNTALAPANRSSQSSNGLKIFVFNTSGQITQTLN